MLAEFIRAIWAWLWREEKSSVAIEGFDLLSRSQREFNEQVLERLDKCDEDRDDLRTKVSELDGRVKACEEDRENLRQQVNRHSIEFKTALGITDDPKPPRRTTRKHFPEPEVGDSDKE